MRDDLNERARQIVATAAAQGSGDFVEQVSCELPLQAIAGPGTATAQVDNTPAGWVYQPSPADTAFYDFTVPQSNNPQLFAGDARIRAAEKSRDLAYRNRYPDFAIRTRSTSLLMPRPILILAPAKGWPAASASMWPS